MANLQGFDAREYEPSRAPLAPVPAGSYNAMIVESEEKQTAKGDGAYLSLVYEILDGDCKGRKVWQNVTLRNPSDDAQRIGREQLSAICHAVGVLTPNDSTDLHNIPLVIVVKVVKRQDNGELKNEVKGWLSREDAAKQKQTPQRPAQATANGQASQQAPAGQGQPAQQGQRPGWMANRQK